MVETIKGKLQDFISDHPEYNLHKVFYGRAYDPYDELPEWNYIILTRDTVNITATKLNNNFNVIVTHEDYIPDGCILELVNHLEKIPGFKLNGEPSQYDYTFKDNTQLIVEGISLSFTWADKRCF